MTRSFLLALLPLALSALLLAQPDQAASSRPSIQNLEAVIQSELGSHGDRVLGDGVYSWNTRLNKIDGCRAELLVRVHYDNRVHYNDIEKEEISSRSETVTFSLGTIERDGIELRKNWLELPCAHKEKCISSASTCVMKTRSGFVVDCGEPSWNRTGSFRLEFDGDDAAASRLEKAFRQAIDLCHVAEPVNF